MIKFIEKLPSKLLLFRNCLYYRGFKETFNIFNELYRNRECYSEWLNKHIEISTQDQNLSYQPLISIVVPVYNTDPRFLTEMIESVKNQIYQNYELCIADDNSTNPLTIEALKNYENDPKIKICYRKNNGGISEATNSAIKITNGDYIALLDHDDVLCSNALLEVVKVLQVQPKLDFIYSNEDKISVDNKLFNPYFKTDLNIELLHSQNYICHFSVIKKTLLEKIGYFESYANGAQDWDIFLRVIENTDKIFHIKKILYHWRFLPNSTSNSAKRTNLYKIQQSVVAKHIERLSLSAKPLIYKPARRLLVQYTPTKSKWFQIEEETTNVADNCDFVLILSKNVKFYNNNWQKECFGILSQANVGAVVGFPIKRFIDDSLINELIKKDYPEEFLPRCSLSAIDHLFLRNDYSPALLYYSPFIVCRREIFNQLSGLNKELLMYFKDIDFCLRILKMGYRVVETPFVKFSVSNYLNKALNNNNNLKQEYSYVFNNWGNKLFQDSYFYNEKLLINS